MTAANKYTAPAIALTTRRTVRVPIVTIHRFFAAFLSAAFVSLSVVGCMPAKRVTGSDDQAVGGAKSEQVQRALSDQSLSPVRRQILMNAENWMGTPYRYGGESKSGTDCSGFVQSVFRSAGISVPRTSEEQSAWGERVAAGRAQPGDLYFFNTSGAGVSHVGIALMDGYFIHASTSRGVIVSSLAERYYAGRFMFARTVLDSGG